MNDIQVLRWLSGLSQRKFGQKYHIPVGTLRNWEQGITKPSDTVILMLTRLVYADLPRLNNTPLRG